MTIVLPAKERRPLCSDNAVFEGVRSARDRYSASRVETDLARAWLTAETNKRWSKNRDCERLFPTTELSRFFHSSRISIDGSIASARRAGIHVARRPSDDIASTAPANTSGSRGVA